MPKDDYSSAAIKGEGFNRDHGGFAFIWIGKRRFSREQIIQMLLVYDQCTRLSPAKKEK